VKISMFHLMPHRELPADFETHYESVWVTPPWCELADARRVGQYYNWTLDELLYAWQIALGRPGEQIFVHPEFDGASNLGGHQGQSGILHEFPGLMAITFLLPRWSEPCELFTIWNPGWDQVSLQNPCTLTEDEIESLLFDYSDGCNDKANESAWRYHVSSLRTCPTRRTSSP